MILPCLCRHPYQDEKYGKGRRVHNPVKKKGQGPDQYRCTVCTNVKEK